MTDIDASSAELVLRHDRDGVATLTLNRPDKRNALNVDLFRALDGHIRDIEQATDTVGLVVLRANGPVFSAGADLGKQQKPPVRHFQAKTIARLAALPQPVVAAVHGPCFTGGLELVLAADIILAAESARFADTHSQWALVPGWGMTARLPRRVGQAKAREMMFTARQYDGRQAEAMGLASLCVADDAFEDALAALCRDIVAQSWHSHRGNKALLNASEGMSRDQALAHEIFASPGVGPDFADRVKGRFGGR
ncbi:enoyl-CoA hydratase/isomerase family protein [Sphingobium sp. Sx8-8]|uniref:enoyl-CoA hydratase/isomerase family protein n=1 Tax=Sphingobium sp. Sx8-8 TaxID=2933617 RepID=UPI001F5AEEA8|nr:enoyl-CoA hydratase/isomerase family protein [Sphingobium sp. Sx8-8]